MHVYSALLFGRCQCQYMVRLKQKHQILNDFRCEVGSSIRYYLTRVTKQLHMSDQHPCRLNGHLRQRYSIKTTVPRDGVNLTSSSFHHMLRFGLHNIPRLRVGPYYANRQIGHHNETREVSSQNREPIFDINTYRPKYWRPNEDPSDEDGTS